MKRLNFISNKIPPVFVHASLKKAGAGTKPSGKQASVFGNGGLAAENLLEADESLGAGPALLLDALQQMQQVVVVAGEDLEENIVLATRVIELHHLGDFAQVFHNLVVLRRVAHVDADKGTGVVAQSGRVEDALRA